MRSLRPWRRALGLLCLAWIDLFYSYEDIVAQTGLLDQLQRVEQRLAEETRPRETFEKEFASRFKKASLGEIVAYLVERTAREHPTPKGWL